MFETRYSDKNDAKFCVLCYDGTEKVGIYDFYYESKNMPKEKVEKAVAENNKMFERKLRSDRFYKYWFPMITLSIGALSSNIDRILTLIQMICQGK